MCLCRMIERSQRDLSFENITNMIDVTFDQNAKEEKKGNFISFVYLFYSVSSMLVKFNIDEITC